MFIAASVSGSAYLKEKRTMWPLNFTRQLKPQRKPAACSFYGSCDMKQTQSSLQLYVQAVVLMTITMMHVSHHVSFRR